MSIPRPPRSLRPLPIATTAAIAASLCCASIGAAAQSVTATAVAAPSPGEIVAATPAQDWQPIADSDLLVMTLAPDAAGHPRRVVIQLLPPPFSEGWIHNIRTLAQTQWWDGTSINRVQDNYVVQWGDAEAAEADAKPLPDGLQAMPQSAYVAPISPAIQVELSYLSGLETLVQLPDNYAAQALFLNGWPLALDGESIWPVHCYGMVGVGRDFAPDTGSGAELYAVIGHAPRHLDRNIALAGRVVEGMEYLSSLPRGTGELSFYEQAEQRVPIESIRLASELPSEDRPRLEVMKTGSKSFAAYADARANRRDPFFEVPAGGADICNIPVPIRPVPSP